MDEKLKGALLVFCGAVSYGILATIVKYANLQHIPTSILVLFQFGFGILTVGTFILIGRKKNPISIGWKGFGKLALLGTTYGMTSVFYYMSLAYIPVTLAIILLMQSIWITILVEYIIDKNPISKLKLLGIILVLGGTALASGIFETEIILNWKGIGLGMLAACSFALSMTTAGKVETGAHHLQRAFSMVFGGMIFIFAFWNVELIQQDFTAQAIKIGALLALFGTVLPPILFNSGFPKVGIGVGSIVASVEMPVSIMSAYIILGERLNLMQWVGVLIILFSVVLVNLPNIRKQKSSTQHAENL